MRRELSLAAGLLAMIALARPAFGDTVEIMIRERGGQPVADQPVTVHPASTVGQPLFLLDPASTRRALTGIDGKVTVDGLPVGSYTITLGPIANPYLIDPRSNPYAPVPTFTVGSGQERIAIQIELWRGVPLTSDVLLDRGELPRCRLVLRSLDGAATVTVPTEATGRADHLLVPGRWEAALEIPPGYLLVDVTQNGESRPGATVRIDVLDDNRAQRVTWSLSARALVFGHVTTIGDPRCLGRVVATLIEPGPWYPEIVARGGSEFRRVPAQFISPPCDYKLWLPDGAWRLEAVGEHVVESTPKSLDVTLAQGEARNVDFAVRPSDDANGSRLLVRVEAPGVRSLADAVVEVWPATRTEDARPLRTAKTSGMFSMAELKDLPAGDYLIVAGHAGYLESSERLEKYEPGDGKTKYVTVTLKEGARISGHATDENDKPVADVSLDIVRVGEPAPTLLADQELAASKAAMSVLTDVTGRAAAKGLPAGIYRASARISGELAGTRFVSVRRGQGKSATELEVQLEESAQAELDLPVRPAASLSGLLVCSDGRSFPAKAAFRVFAEGNERPDSWRERELRKDAALALDDVRLTGNHLDRFRVGPLTPGAYLLAVRLVGYEFWTWVQDVLVAADASVLRAADTSGADIGAAPVECSPLVRISPRVLSGETLPDFRIAEIEGKLESATLPGRIELHESQAFLRGLPEGKAKLSLTLRHPYLIPASLVMPAADVDLIRGKLVTLAPAFQRVGGLVDVHVKGAAARLVPADGEAAIRLAVASKVAFPGTPPGKYRVDDCEDSACVQVTHSWQEIAVDAEKTVILREP